ncbi:hypothetical protein M2352_001906 [Azospirillum fermentarium]|uniref:hypothetical protein n=1 Tax=Azospirillum fermentarium TaxID=1233114 RepID=UPI002225C6BE|nr:hypothetical protein [Azospirillum fermentarium]MCW2246315.1 hypothetical protein [Azospirillum fermentarium]
MQDWKAAETKPGYRREDAKALLNAIERQAREAMQLSVRAQRDMKDNRFASFLDFRKKVEEVRSLVALTEERFNSMPTARIDDLRVEFERMDILLTRVLIRSMHTYFLSMPEDQLLPIGARELFEPELRNIDEVREKLSRPQFAEKVEPEVLEQLEETAVRIRKVCQRVPALPDFSDSPTPPKPMRRLRNMTTTVRS